MVTSVVRGVWIGVGEVLALGDSEERRDELGYESGLEEHLVIVRTAERTNYTSTRSEVAFISHDPKPVRSRQLRLAADAMPRLTGATCV